MWVPKQHRPLSMTGATGKARGTKRSVGCNGELSVSRKMGNEKWVFLILTFKTINL